MTTPTRLARFSPLANRHPWAWTALSTLLLAGALCLSPQRARAADANAGFSIGMSAQPRAEAAEIGLPVYPGAVPNPDAEDQQAGATLRLWGGPFGMKLQLLKLKSSDRPADVARFYRDALARQGPVLDCTEARTQEPALPAASKELQCGDERPAAGGYIFKAGTKGSLRVVNIEPLAGGSKLQLVRLETRGD
jgi:hypothetical protein